MRKVYFDPQNADDIIPFRITISSTFQIRHRINTFFFSKGKLENEEGKCSKGNESKLIVNDDIKNLMLT